MSLNFSNITYKILQQNKPATYRNAIAFCVDKNYLPYALFVAKQILELEKNLEFDICICLPNLALVPEDFLQMNIRFVEVDINGFDNLPVDHLSLAAYYRLFLPHIFANDYQYIFYLDADTYVANPVIDDITRLIDSFPDDFTIAVATDITEIYLRLSEYKHLKKIQSYLHYYHEKEHTYRNSGVLLFNVQKYIQSNCLERIFNYAFDENSNLQFHDQSALNGGLMNELEILPFKLNWQIHKLNYKLVEEMNPSIIHFIGENKPWHLDNEMTKPYQKEYQAYLKRYYPNLANRLESKYQRRLHNKKYDNRMFEFLSREMIPVKQFLKRTVVGSQANKLRKTKDVLSKLPFVL